MKTSCAVLGLAGLLLAGTANASLLPGNAIYSSFVTLSTSVDNASPPDYPLALGTATTGGSPLAQEFNVSAPTTLTSLWLRLSDQTPSDGGSILVYLVPDDTAHNTPTSIGLKLTGATLLATVLDSGLPRNSTDLGCSFGAGANVNACNTLVPIMDTISTPADYWIALVNGSDGNNGGTNPNSSGALWWKSKGSGTALNPGLNTVGVDNADALNGGWNVGSTSAYELQVNAPEPAGMAVLGAGLVGLGFARRRRNKKSAG